MQNECTCRLADVLPGRWEHWLRVPGFPEYEVSEQGRVRSCVQFGPGTRKPLTTPKVLTPKHTSHNGHLRVKVRNADGESFTKYLHTLVALAFLGPRPPGAQIRHLSGNKCDNSTDNLAYGTSAENGIDKVLLGEAARGEAHALSKLTEADVHEIRQRLRAGESQSSISRSFGVRPLAIQRIHRGGTWAWLPCRL